MPGAGGTSIASEAMQSTTTPACAPAHRIWSSICGCSINRCAGWIASAHAQLTSSRRRSVTQAFQASMNASVLHHSSTMLMNVSVGEAVGAVVVAVLGSGVEVP